jgi:hypothetical protein
MAEFFQDEIVDVTGDSLPAKIATRTASALLMVGAMTVAGSSSGASWISSGLTCFGCFAVRVRAMNEFREVDCR